MLVAHFPRYLKVRASSAGTYVSLGVNAFYQIPPNGEMTMSKMDHIARLRLGCMFTSGMFSELVYSTPINRQEVAIVRRVHGVVPG